MSRKRRTCMLPLIIRGHSKTTLTIFALFWPPTSSWHLKSHLPTCFVNVVFECPLRLVPKFAKISEIAQFAILRIEEITNFQEKSKRILIKSPGGQQSSNYGPSEYYIMPTELTLSHIRRINIIHLKQPHSKNRFAGQRLLIRGLKSDRPQCARATDGASNFMIL